ncbi:MAG TPA: iron-sulfur cluster insertion protein ErpA [Gammaproteobacteria bacterium]|jgi:iron-sulfur cluster insertion protein|nr:iron-sulfur cluster insertion protein ErpA [Gammaproteobacteria bacterium]
MSASLIFTSKAAAKVWELIQEEGNFNLKLRAFITGGGCSGYQYGFKFDETIEEDDTVVSQTVGDGEQQVQLLVDPLSLQYLAGAEIDYKEDIEGEQFIIRNPNAKTTCGCGSSFTVKEEEEKEEEREENKEEEVAS